MTAEAGGASPAVRKDYLRRPQRLSFPEHAEAHLLKNPPAGPPSRTVGYRRSAAVASRLNASHACTRSTVREYRFERNEKSMLCCAEAVEDNDSLWKQKENWK